MKVSVIIRTLNEETHLRALLDGVNNQNTKHEVEIVVIDSGSTDKTLLIASENFARITHIEKEKFSFGRSLNKGCNFANGEVLVFVSGHCIPEMKIGSTNLLRPSRKEMQGILTADN